MRKILLIMIILTITGCNQEKADSTKIEISAKTETATESEEPCDDVEAPKVEITEEGVNLLDEEEGCKLPE